MAQDRSLSAEALRSLCAQEIDIADIDLGEKVGEGHFGEVYRGQLRAPFVRPVPTPVVLLFLFFFLFRCYSSTCLACVVFETLCGSSACNAGAAWGGGS